MRHQGRLTRWKDDHGPARFSSYSNLPACCAVGWLLFVTGAANAGLLAKAVPAFYFVMSCVAFLAYAIDKTAAKADSRRTSENTLHVLGLLGGWPGALAAQRLLRHKSQKRSFRFVLWVTVFLNCAMLGWLVTPAGRAMWYQLLKI